MKKILAFLMALILCIGMVGCGSDDKDTGTNEPEVKKIEKTTDAIVSELGLTDEKQEKAFEMVGAKDGAGYGKYEIYIYDESSDAYKDITGDGYDMGITVIKATASNSGAVLIYSGEGDADQTIIDKFNAIVFK